MLSTDLSVGFQVDKGFCNCFLVELTTTIIKSYPDSILVKEVKQRRQ